MAVVYKYVGKTRAGVSQAGEVTAATREEAAVLLRRQNIVATSIKPKAAGFELKIPGFGGRIKDKDVVIFTRQFATMIDAGLPLVQCLEILTKQTENKTFAEIIGKVRTDVEGGSTFADALGKHPKGFNSLYVSMVRAGEAGGILDTVLNRLAVYIEKAMKLKKKIKSAMIYPGVVIGVAVGVISIIMIWVIPVFEQMFAGFGATLPLLTLTILRISRFMSSWTGGGIILGAIIASIVGIRFARKTPKGKKFFDAVTLKFPIFGILLRKYAVAKFTRTLGTLINSGVPILDGLNITAETAGNKVVEEAILMARQRVSEGKMLNEPLTESKVFPPMVVQMIAVGETTGALDTMLGKIADFYDDEVDVAVSNLTSLLEPILMIFLGVVIGTIVIAMYLPIFKMITVIK